ncbi:MAG: hypothetical protein V1773_03870 [bacterium]
MLKYLSKIVRLFFCFNYLLLYAELPEITLNKIRANYPLILSAATLNNINPYYLAAIIYTERTLNYDWEDDAMDIILADAGLNSSIGFCQVKIKTAYFIEKNLQKQYLPLSKTFEQLLTKLKNDSLNILYAAGYIKLMINRWEKDNCSIKEKPEILGTLYSTGLYYRDGRERVPNTNPKSNRFGSLVKEALGVWEKYINKGYIKGGAE